MIALIPARGGSKGVPGKNIKLLAGKPLIAYTIEAALEAKYIDRIIISTDDPVIADVCRDYNVEIPFMRPAELSTDDALAIDNYIYTIDRLNDEFNHSIKEYTVLLPTVPLRIAADIDSAIDLFNQRKADSVISCYPLHCPLEWIFQINDDGSIKPHQTTTINKMMNRQTTTTGFIPNGAVYVFKHKLLKEKYTYYSTKTHAYVMPEQRSVDIDTLKDFQQAEYLINERNINVN